MKFNMTKSSETTSKQTAQLMEYIDRTISLLTILEKTISDAKENYLEKFCNPDNQPKSLKKISEYITSDMDAFIDGARSIDFSSFEYRIAHIEGLFARNHLKEDSLLF